MNKKPARSNNRGNRNSRSNRSSKNPKNTQPKFCQFCLENAVSVDYKNIKTIYRYISQYGKIQPKYYSGVCLNHQKKLGNAIKLARFMALLPYVR